VDSEDLEHQLGDRRQRFLEKAVVRENNMVYQLDRGFLDPVRPSGVALLAFLIGSFESSQDRLRIRAGFQYASFQGTVATTAKVDLIRDEGIRGKWETSDNIAKAICQFELCIHG